MSFKKNRPPRLTESSSGVLHQLAPILIVGAGIAFNGLVGLIALMYSGDTLSLVKLLAMEVPVASVYVSGGNRISMLIHLGLFVFIGFASAPVGNPGLAFAACTIMSYSVLKVLQQLAWKQQA